MLCGKACQTYVINIYAIKMNHVILQHEWGRREMHIGYWWENQNEIDHLVNQDVDRWIILKCILREIGRGGMDWIDLAQDRNQ
jgi:hypothetical protein